jgi:hypothetical protein
VVPALLAAIDVRSAESPAIEAMAEKIRAGVDPQQLAAWRERLEGAIWLDEPGYGARFADALLETTRRVGLVAATDVRGVARLLGRIDDTLPRLQSMGRLEELEHYLGASPPVRSLLAFAASATYGRLVAPPA